MIFITKAFRDVLSLFSRAGSLLVLLFVFLAPCLRAQPSDDSLVALRYSEWAKLAMDAGRWSEALAALERAADFSSVSSDISYQLALARSREGKSRGSVVEALNRAIEVNRWVIYNENLASLLKAEQFIATRAFSSALSILDNVIENSDSACLRLLAYKGLISGSGISTYNTDAALESFRALTLSAMNRFSRDPRPLRIFFQYARERYPEQSDMSPTDINLLDLAIRRLPFLLESDSELAWMAAPFMRDTEDARRLIASYRAGGIPNIRNRDFYPSPRSIPVALYLGLIDDARAVEELFSGSRGFNSPLPSGVIGDGYPVLDLDVVTEVYRHLREEKGRFLFTEKLLNFSGRIISDDDNDTFIDSIAYYRSGGVYEFILDKDQDNVPELKVKFLAGVPVSAEYLALGQSSRAEIVWERYPSVKSAVLAEENFSFRPADFQYAPVSFIVLGGSGTQAGVSYPILSRHPDLTRVTLVSSSSSVSRASIEFPGAIEQIFLEKAIPIRAFERLGDQYVSFTEFERGIPVIQYLDLDIDGKMETIRRFHRPPQDQILPANIYEKFYYHSLIASSESDWTGEGRYKTGELYPGDGSVVYLWDIDGGGVMNYSETNTENH